MAEPPVAPAEKAIDNCPFPAVIPEIVGALGVVAGVTLLESLLETLFPTLFVAITVKVYPVPLVKPVTIIGDEVPVPVKLPGFDVTVYPVIADPPFEAGGENATETSVFPLVADPITGASGTVGPDDGVTLLEALLAALFPTEFVATTENV